MKDVVIVNKSDIDEAKQKYQEALESIMKEDSIKEYFKTIPNNQKMMSIQELDARITNEVLNNIDKSKYLIM